MSNSEAKAKVQSLADKYAKIAADNNDKLDRVNEDKLSADIDKELGMETIPMITSSKNKDGEVSVSVFICENRFPEPTLSFTVYGFGKGEAKEDTNTKKREAGIENEQR